MRCVWWGILVELVISSEVHLDRYMFVDNVIRIIRPGNGFKCRWYDSGIFRLGIDNVARALAAAATKFSDQ